MNLEVLDAYAKRRIAIQLAKPPQYFRNSYWLKRNVKLIGFRDMDEVLSVIKLLGGYEQHNAIKMPGHRRPIWSSRIGLNVLELWEILCNDRKPFDKRVLR